MVVEGPASAQQPNRSLRPSLILAIDAKETPVCIYTLRLEKQDQSWDLASEAGEKETPVHKKKEDTKENESMYRM